MAKKEALVVQAKVKALIKKNKMNTASDVMAALTTVVEQQVIKACARAKSNGRKTVRANDF
jgi:histone H3/H4